MKIRTQFLGFAVSALLSLGCIAQANAQEMDTLSKKQQAIVPIAAMTAKGDVENLKTAISEGLDAELTISVENPLKVVPLIHSNLTPVKFSHSPFCLFLFSSYSSCPLCRVLH